MSNIKKVKNGISYETNGWIYVAIKGKAKERGYAYGKLVAYEMKDIQKNLQFTTYFDLGVKWDFLLTPPLNTSNQKLWRNSRNFTRKWLGLLRMYCWRNAYIY